MTSPNHHTIGKARKYEADGQLKTLAEWARHTGTSTESFRARFYSRLKIGWNIEDAILIPPRIKHEPRVRTGLKPGRRRNAVY